MFKKSIRIILLITVIIFIVSNCQNTQLEKSSSTGKTNSIEEPEQYLEPVSVEKGEMTPEIKALIETPLSVRASCGLGIDVACGCAPADIEDFVLYCTTYPKPSEYLGLVSYYTYSFIFYVDSDSDINLDKYEYVFQAHVDNIINNEGPVLAIIGDIISWECNDRSNNLGIIQYTVVK